MTAPDIRPTLSAPDSPTCSGEACPAYHGLTDGIGTCSDGNGRTFTSFVGTGICIPMLRRLLATRTEELVKARSKLRAAWLHRH